MDQEFIRLISESYCSDRNLEIKEKEKIFELIQTNIQKCREINPYLLDDFYKRTKSYQQDAIYEFLDEIYNPELIQEIDINQIIQNLENMAQNVRDFHNQRVVPFARGLWNFGRETVNLTRRIATPIARALTDAIKKIYKKYREYTETEQDKLIRILTEKNFNNCFNRCRQPDFAEQGSQEHCLVFCSLDYLINVYANTHIAYRRCLENLGHDLGGYDDIMQEFPMDDNCSKLYDFAQETYSEIRNILNQIPDPRIRQEWFRYINLKIKAAKEGRIVRIDYNKLKLNSINPNDLVV